MPAAKPVDDSDSEPHRCVLPRWIAMAFMALVIILLVAAFTCAFDAMSNACVPEGRLLGCPFYENITGIVRYATLGFQSCNGELNHDGYVFEYCYVLNFSLSIDASKGAVCSSTIYLLSDEDATKSADQVN